MPRKFGVAKKSFWYFFYWKHDKATLSALPNAIVVLQVAVRTELNGTLFIGNFIHYFCNIIVNLYLFKCI